ncbi:PH domain-containing protein [Liquorilactobacillus sicerae]|uniref:PH domain-containing protein n=1 Tax=Liquorilactobacillus sicerae TaxID=1416943 RepID=UPI0024813524|nr:PH domain-containing protein [Liquorilactobacillus sicerae]
MKRDDYPLLAQSLPSKIKIVWLADEILLFIVSTAVILLAWTLIAHFFHPKWLNLTATILLGLVVIVLVSGVWLIPYHFKFNRYEINKTEIAIQKGWLFRETIFVPIVRIQHVEIEQGPLLRWQKLAVLKIHTAATTHELAGLCLTEANGLRQKIIDLLRVVNEDV